MKFIVAVVLALLAIAFVAANDGPISIDSNNIGDIVNVDIQGNLVLSNNQHQDIINVLFALLNSSNGGESVIPPDNTLPVFP